ncbi:MAG: hypothetical protein L6R35_005839 [Caloplaca aegaea]|nr:MAG: hypothetical protein L6R35_005839 [Caloplaca aegaea]
MHSTVVLLALLGLSSAAPRPQLIDTAYNVSFHQPVIGPRGHLDKRDGDCRPQLLGSGPLSFPDNPETFAANPVYSSLALNAPNPDGYSSAMKNLDASLDASNYISNSTLTSYDTLGCASLCNRAVDCQAFNLYIERDPILDPNTVLCPNPASTTNFICTLWGTAVSAAQATNRGSLRASFRVVIAGSNAYNKAPPPPSLACYTGPTAFGGAIKAPRNALGQDTFLGNRFYPFSADQAYNTSTCAAYCTEVTGYNSRHPAPDGSYKTCAFFNPYALTKNGVPTGFQCALYTDVWDASYGTNYASGRREALVMPTRHGVVIFLVTDFHHLVLANINPGRHVVVVVVVFLVSDFHLLVLVNIRKLCDLHDDHDHDDIIDCYNIIHDNTTTAQATTSSTTSQQGPTTSSTSSTIGTTTTSTSTVLTTSTTSAASTPASTTTSSQSSSTTSSVSSTTSSSSAPTTLTTSSSTTSTSSISTSTSTSAVPFITGFCLQNPSTGEYAHLSRGGNGLEFAPKSAESLPSLYTLDASSRLVSTVTGLIAVLDLPTFGRDGSSAGYTLGVDDDQLGTCPTYEALVCDVSTGDLQCRSAANYIDPVKTPATRSLVYTLADGNNGVDRLLFAPASGAVAVKVRPGADCGQCAITYS